MQEVKTKKAKKSFFLRLAVFVFICYVAVMPVSYTHLDVYKRQSLINDIYDSGSITPEELKVFTILLNPFAPHVTEEVWSLNKLGEEMEMCIRDRVWADRSGADLVKQGEGSDPAAVVFDAISAAKSRNADVIICDTAGRLHNKKNLMDELSKIGRIIDRELPAEEKEILLVLDAATGQNAVNQAREFKNY